MEKQTVRIKKAHVALMKHPETALYSGVMLMGTSEVVEDAKFTAYTDGVNKKYGLKFLKTVSTNPKLRGLVMHENLHVALKHIPRGVDMWKKDARIANIAADYVVNDIIHNITGTIGGGDERIVELPDGAYQDDMFHDWNMRKVFNYLISNPPPDGQGSGEGEGEGDVHDFEGVSELTHEQAKEVNDAIDKALREGGILAGRMGGKVPRAISELLAPKVDWKEVLREFITSSCRGSEELTWRKMNKRYLVNDMYLPSYETETMGEVTIAIDTSGSIGSKELTEFASELASICGLCSPERVRVLWWDTIVHGEQVFETDYADIATLLKPLGGGGTHVSCVSEYIAKHKLNSECVIIFTDGYLEDNIRWNITMPSLWLVTQNKSFEPPQGMKVNV
jgi:predicted metal-dependent peptidase